MNEMKMSQVVYNFLSNAVKHSNIKGIIEVNMIDSEEKLRVEVKDNGDGISKDAIDVVTIFQTLLEMAASSLHFDGRGVEGHLPLFIL